MKLFSFCLNMGNFSVEKTAHDLFRGPFIDCTLLTFRDCEFLWKGYWQGVLKHACTASKASCPLYETKTESSTKMGVINAA